MRELQACAAFVAICGAGRSCQSRATFPVHIDQTGKRPLVGGYLKLGTNRSAELATRPKYADCNGIGFRVDRPYGPKITVLDIDVVDEREVPKAIQRHVRLRSSSAPAPASFTCTTRTTARGAGSGRGAMMFP